MIGHTAGPWMVLPSVTPTQFVILTESGPRKDIACTYGFEHDPREANAQLISAAPELLEALVAILETSTYDDYPNTPEHKALERGRAVVAKATGSAA